MKLALRARALGKKFTLVTTAFVLAVSSLTASVPFILSERANAASDTAYAGASFSSLAWGADRRAPTAGYVVSPDGSSLSLSVNSAASVTQEYEGVKATLPTSGSDSVRASLYINPDWAGKKVRTGIWGISSDGSSVSWPIIEYINNSELGQQGIRVWDTNTGEWYTTGMPNPAFGTSVNLEVAVNATTSEYEFYVDGALVKTYGTYGYNDLTGVILNSRNFVTGNSADSYTTNWSNLAIGSRVTAAPTGLNARFVNPTEPVGFGGVVSSKKVASTALELKWTAPTAAATITGYRINAAFPDGTTKTFVQGANTNGWLRSVGTYDYYGNGFGQHGDGEYTYTVSTVAGGVTSAPSDPFTISYDSTDPIIEAVSINDGDVVGGGGSLSVHVSDNVKLATLVVNFKKNGTVVTGGNNKIALTGKDQTEEIALPAGLSQYTDYSFTIGLVDAAGNDAYANRTFRVDNTKPSVSYASPAHGGRLNRDGIIKVNYHDDVIVSKMNVSIVGRSYAQEFTINNKTGVQDIPVSSLGLPDGTYTVRSTITDSAGNVSGVADRLFTIDTIAPTVTWQLSPNAYYGEGDGFHVRPITNEVGTKKAVYIDEVAPENLVWELTSDHKNFDTKSQYNQTLWDGLSDGTHTFIAVFTDYADNTTVSESVSFVIDRSAPVIHLNEQSTPGYYTEAKRAGLWVEDVNFKEARVYKWNGTEYVFTDSTYTTSNLDLTELSDGAYKVIAEDEAGNTAEAEFSIDTTGPSAPTLTGAAVRYMQSGNVTRTWNKSTSDDVVKYVYKSFNSEAAALAPATSVGWSPDAYAAGLDSYSITHTTGVANRTFWYRVAAVDAAGNQTWSSEIYKVVIDNDLPNVAITDINIVGKQLTFNVSGGDGLSGANTVGVNIYDESGARVISIGRLAHNIAPETLSVGPYTIGPVELNTLTTGVYTIRAAVRDYAGNIQYVNEVFSVDNTPITVDISTASILGNVITPRVVADEVPASFSWEQTGGQEDGVVFDDSLLEPGFAVVNDGSYSFKLTVFDAAGNSTVKTFNFTYTTPSTSENTDTSSDGSGSGDGGSDASTSVQQISLPLATSPVSGFSNAGVLGASDAAANDGSDNSEPTDSSTADTLAAAVDNTDGKAFGLAWYWWLLIVAAVAALGWWIVGAIRRRQAEEN